MATRRKAPPRKAAAHKVTAKTKATVEPKAKVVVLAPIPEGETAQQAIDHIAQDAVVILRRELAHKAETAMQWPGRVSMSDCIALLRLTADLGEAARKGEGESRADYSRLSAEERVQLAQLLLKVDYA